ncbi:MAG: hypothetical protein JWN14_4421 [Chthonomonadales bacterium]|nr:hypothetical protein [Chthonomonadales bacterium]
MAHSRHTWVRQRFHARCGYCGVSETDVGGELTVDHYVPVIAGGDDSDDNLIYACVRCNLYKGDYTVSSNAALDERVLHPLNDTLSDHYVENEVGVLESQTPRGMFHIALLRLNRPQLIQHRRRKRARKQMETNLTLLLHLIEHQENINAEQTQALELLRLLLNVTSE